MMMEEEVEDETETELQSTKMCGAVKDEKREG